MAQFQELDNLFKEFGIGVVERIEPEPDVAVVEENIEEWLEIGEEDEYEVMSGRRVAERTEEYIKGLAAEADSESEPEPEAAADTCQKFANRVCKCQTNCIEQFQEGTIKDHILSLRELEKGEKEMYIMGALQKVGTDDTRKGKRQRIRYRFVHDGRTICRPSFLYINYKGSKALRNLQKHMGMHGTVPRVHGNTGRKPHHALKYDDVRYCVDWLIWYASVNGLPMPAAPRGQDGEAPIMLPSALTKKELHQIYLQRCIEAGVRSLGLTSFKDVWKNCVPHIRIMTPKDDVCQKCEILRKKVADSVSEAEKLQSATLLREHVQDGQKERELYIQTIREAEDEMSTHDLQDGPVQPLSSDLTKVHYTFDYSQNVTLPHHSQQMGPMYFVTGRKVQMFGVHVDSTKCQYNYLIDEDESIGSDGTGRHGPNSVISMLHHCMFRRGFGEKGCVLHADNAGGSCMVRNFLSWPNKYLHFQRYHGLLYISADTQRQLAAICEREVQ